MHLRQSRKQAVPLSQPSKGSQPFLFLLLLPLFILFPSTTHKVLTLCTTYDLSFPRLKRKLSQKDETGDFTFSVSFSTKTCRFKCCSHTYKGGKGIAGNGGGGIVKRAAAPPFQGGRRRRRKKEEERRRKSPLLWVCGLRWLQRDYLGRGAEFTDREETYKIVFS